MISVGMTGAGSIGEYPIRVRRWFAGVEVVAITDVNDSRSAAEERETLVER